jgi:predicted DCC family thiol-disulfide oxidoreductase YuxK
LNNSQHVILFDGVCNLCNGFVQFIIKRDKKGHFTFGALQTKAAQELLSAYDFSPSLMTTIVLIEDGNAYTQSDAVLRIAKRLKGGWKLLYGFIVLPRFFRDGAYGLVSRYRYKIFGKRNECMIPTPEIKRRFLAEANDL